MVPCPLCGSPRAEPLFEKDGCAFERCAGCGLATRGGADAPPSYHDYLPELTRTLPPLTRRRYEDLLGRLEPYRRTGRFLDVGCGGGFLVETARDLGWDAEGIEVSHAAAEFGTSRGLRIRTATLEEAALPADAFDLVTLMEVVEHVPDPVGLLRRAAALLRPGGAIYLTTPNWASLSRRVLGSRWSAIGRDHVVYFTPRLLRRALATAGLRPRRVVTANVQPHELLAVVRRARDVPAQPDVLRGAMALRDTVESNALLRAAKHAANALLAATGTGDTIRALAERPASAGR